MVRRRNDGNSEQPVSRWIVLSNITFGAVKTRDGFVVGRISSAADARYRDDVIGSCTTNVERRLISAHLMGLEEGSALSAYPHRIIHTLLE